MEILAVGGALPEPPAKFEVRGLSSVDRARTASTLEKVDAAFPYRLDGGVELAGVNRFDGDQRKIFLRPEALSTADEIEERLRSHREAAASLAKRDPERWVPKLREHDRRLALAPGSWNDVHTAYIDRRAYLEGVVRHEAGHAVHYQYRDEFREALGWDYWAEKARVWDAPDFKKARDSFAARNEALGRKYGITDRGRDNLAEAIAESVAAWVAGFESKIHPVIRQVLQEIHDAR